MKELVSPNVAARSNPGAAACSGRAAPSRRERGSWRRTGEDAGTGGVTASARTPGRSGSRSRFRTPGCRVRSSRLRARPSRTTGGRRTRASPLRTRRRGLLRRLRQEDASWRQPRQGKTHPYYKRRRVFRDGMNACSDGGSRPDHRAEKLEGRTWGFVSDPMKNPHQLRQDLKRMVEWERREPRRDPEREAMAWLEKLARTDRGRRGYQDLAAKGLMTPGELGEKLEGLVEMRAVAEREPEALWARQDRIERLERDKEEVPNTYARMPPEALAGLPPRSATGSTGCCDRRWSSAPSGTCKRAELSGRGLRKRRRHQGSSLKISMIPPQHIPGEAPCAS